MQHENEVFLSKEPLPEVDASISLEIVSAENVMRGPELAQKKILEGKITLNPQSVRISPIAYNAGATAPSNQALETRWKFYLVIMPFTLHRAPGTNRYQSVTLFINLNTPNVTAFDLFPKNITTQISTTTFYTITPDMRIREVQANSGQTGQPLIHFETLYPQITSFGEGENRFYWTYDSYGQQKEVPPETKYVLALLRVAQGTEVVEGTISYEVVIAKNLLGMWRTTNSEVAPYPIRWELAKSPPTFSPNQPRPQVQPAKGSNTPPHIDVCILCALAEEAEMLKEAFKSQLHIDFQRTRNPRLRREYDYTTIPNSDREPLGILVTWLPNFGPLETGLALKSLYEEFKPRFMAMTGICAGDRKKVKLGDIIVAERAFFYDAGKVVEGEGGRKELLRDTHTWSPPLEVVHFARGFTEWRQVVNHEHRPSSKQQQRDWLLSKLLDPQTPRVDDIPDKELEEHVPDWRKIVRALQYGEDAYLTPDRKLKDRTKVYDLRFGEEVFPFKDSPRPTVYIEPTASGMAVRSDNPFDEIRLPVRGTLAIDMEGTAFYRTLSEFNDLHYLLVKGISDYADSEKDDSYHSYAAKVSALYMLAFIKEYVTSSRLPGPAQKQTHDQTRGTRAQGASTPITSVNRTPVTSQADQQKEFNIFYSYAPEDELLRKELDKHLAMLRRQGWINQVYAHDIGQGGLMKADLTARLQQAKLILLLISPDFLFSDSLYEEQLQPALQLQEDNKARIIPILLRTTGLEDTPLEKFVVLPRNNKPIVEWRSRDAAFAEVAKEIREVIKQLRDPNA
jgi:nucleoside phosphorylase